MNYNTLFSGAWKHRRKIMFAGTLAYGATLRGFDYKEVSYTSKNTYHDVKYQDRTFADKALHTLNNLNPIPFFGRSLFHDIQYNGRDLREVFSSPREIIGSAIVSVAPVTFVGLAVGLKALDFGLNMVIDQKNASLRQKLTKKSVKEEKVDTESSDYQESVDNAILKAGDTELGKLYKYESKDHSNGKTLTVFFNHGNAENFKDWNGYLGPDSIRSDAMFDRIKSLNPPYKTINYVRVKQGYEQPVIADKLIDHFKGDDNHQNEFAIIGFSAGCTSSLQQEKIFQEKNIPLKHIILTAPVVDGVGAIMPASIRWLVKPLESVILNSGLLNVGGSSWHWTCAEALSKADKTKDNNLTIMYNKNDHFTKNTYIPQPNLIKSHLPNREFELRRYTTGGHNAIKFPDIAEILLNEKK